MDINITMYTSKIKLLAFLMRKTPDCIKASADKTATVFGKIMTSNIVNPIFTRLKGNPYDTEGYRNLARKWNELKKTSLLNGFDPKIEIARKTILASKLDSWVKAASFSERFFEDLHPKLPISFFGWASLLLVWNNINPIGETASVKTILFLFAGSLPITIANELSLKTIKAATTALINRKKDVEEEIQQATRRMEWLSASNNHKF
ncbi:hypothetical protein A2526_03790 [candidate division WOR-1 bacterium RIFOXYD2_FULL_36_8]|nr:MAG: hypothetical protein A2282_04115 [candidate division WOR-1 bacterium RIFOXYA12_FULL_36_13]OGC38106.1 MAG: hypothetical protein A2526_03790 [candidate division WOR-1 bacterium RIFOXYD2_FULL_36_8]